MRWTPWLTPAPERMLTHALVLISCEADDESSEDLLGPEESESLWLELDELDGEPPAVSASPLELEELEGEPPER